MKVILNRMSLFVLLLECSCICYSESIMEAEYEKFIQCAGGTNYAFYDVQDEYLKRNEPHSWWKPGVLKHVVGAFHLQPAGFVEQTLKQMYSNGQRKIALVLWYVNITEDKRLKGAHWTNPVPTGYEHIYGHIIDSAKGALCPQHQKNLKAVLSLIYETGFEDVTIRFAAQGVNNPMEWDTWNADYYRENHDFIVSTKEIADAILKDKIPVYYDLGLELGGLQGSCTRYTTQLWQDYIERYGAEDTFGFSFAVEPGRVGRMLKIYKQSGSYPVAYPLDIYNDADKRLAYVAKELEQAGLSDSPIIIQETFYNDAQTYKEIKYAAERFDLNILYIMQWQVERCSMYWHGKNGEKKHRHFSVVGPVDYENYLYSFADPTKKDRKAK